MIVPPAENHPLPRYSNEIAAFLKEMLESHFPGQILLQDACSISDDSLEDIYEKAYDHYSAGEGAHAAKQFGMLITLDPFQQRFWMGLAASQHLEKQYKKALQAYALAALLDDRDPAPHYHAAQCYLAMGNKNEAIKALDLAEAHASQNSALLSFCNQIRNLKETLLLRVNGSK
jgi:type III secretion system low calcium response chaperone LcrH/SycD